MGRLIDVDALKVDYGMAEDCKDCKTGYRSCDFDRNYSKMDFCGWLDDAPTVDAVPVRHGRWIPKFNGKFKGGAYWYECSECRHTVPGGLQSGKIFCENCGADMRKDGDDAEGTV